MVRAIIFDCFGVLVEDALKIVKNELTPGKAQEFMDLLHASHVGLMTMEESDRRGAKLLGVSLEAYHRKLSDGEVKNIELLNYIEHLHSRYKTAILSNIGTGGIARRFTADELQSFDTVVASGEIGYAKPEPEAYEITADRLGVRLDECVFTDDHEEYCEGARGVGMQAILYTNFTQFKADLEKLLTDS